MHNPERSVCDILLSIEQKVTNPPKEKRKLRFPVRLPRRAVDAMELVLAVHKGGETNDSIRSHLAENAGVAVQWAQNRGARDEC